MQLLLDKCANVNLTGGEYGCALQAASDSGHENIVQLLLAKGAVFTGIIFEETEELD